MSRYTAMTCIGKMLDTHEEITPAVRPRSIQATREVRRNTALRQARTCYDHIAGIAGVQLLDALLEHGWLESKKTGDKYTVLYHLTSRGEDALRDRGVDVTGAGKARRRFAYGCVDWTERCMHLGGSLGAAVLGALIAAGVVQRQGESRVLRLQRPLADWFESPAKGL